MAGTLSLVVNAQACGPDFDSAYFVRSTERKYLAIPEGDFFFELKRIGDDTTSRVSTDGYVKRVSDADIEDLKKSLKNRKVMGRDFDEAVASYQKSRDEINSFLQECPVEDSSLWYGGRFRSHERVKSNLVKGEKNSLLVQLPQPKRYGIRDSAPEGFNKTDQKSYVEPTITLTSKVPEEFRLYLTGALKYHFNDFSAAIQEWEKILTLPESERKFKSTWALFMIGKAHLSLRDQKRAIPYFINTRERAEKGYSDSLGLAWESFGWQALAEYEQKEYVLSIQHYLKQMDAHSLNWLCKKIFETEDKTIAAIVKDGTARSVLLGWAVSQPFWNAMEWGEDETYRDFFSRLLAAIEGIKKTGPVDYADRVAWLYYIKGNETSVKRWLALAKFSTPLAQFIDFKLSLREGKVDEAIQKLSKVMSSFEKSRDKDIFSQEDAGRLLNSDMAVLKLSRQEYLKAFELLLQGKFWEDIAYVAEKVLTEKELEGFLKADGNKSSLSKRQKFYQRYYYAYAPTWSKAYPDESEWQADSFKEGGPTLREALEYLLARRLARQGKWEEAIKYMPAKAQIDREYIEKKDKTGATEYEPVSGDIDCREKLKELHDLLLRAQNEKSTRNDRAKAYYEAGIIVRRYGMELMGTELDPDGFVYRGTFPYYGSIENRFGILTDEAKIDYERWNKEELAKKAKLREQIKKNRGFFYGSDDEEDRAMSSLPSPDKRFHYRYKAADLMWKSAQLLLDNDERRAKALCVGGTFIKTRDLKRADKFYKELVRTCGKTDLGRQANKLKWFPKITY